MSKHSGKLTGKMKGGRGRGGRARELLSGTAKRVVSGKTEVISDIKCLNAVQLSQRRGTTALFLFAYLLINVITSA